jgi:hypothetical protein
MGLRLLLLARICQVGSASMEDDVDVDDIDVRLYFKVLSSNHLFCLFSGTHSNLLKSKNNRVSRYVIFLKII